MSDLRLEVVLEHLIEKTSSFRVNPEKHIAKWIASKAIMNWNPEKGVWLKWDKKVLRKSEVSQFVKMLKLNLIKLTLEPTPREYKYEGFVDIGGDEIGLEFEIPLDWKKSKIYDNVYSLALHELTHVQHDLKKRYKFQPFPRTPIEYVTRPSEIEGHLKQFKSLMIREGLTLEEIIVSSWENFLSKEELEGTLELYRAEYKKLYGRDAP